MEKDRESEGERRGLIKGGGGGRVRVVWRETEEEGSCGSSGGKLLLLGEQTKDTRWGLRGGRGETCSTCGEIKS